MDKIITLEMISYIQNWLGHGVRIAFCSTEDDGFEVLEKIDCSSFHNIIKKVEDIWKYKVFRLDTLNDLICAYVVALE